MQKMSFFAVDRLVVFLAAFFFSVFSVTAGPVVPLDSMEQLAPPIKIPLQFSATFAELRDNHFHSGVDIRTGGREGVEIYAPADGYVSRIRISETGYGKALYITHPNGLTTVYGHLKRYAPQIEDYVKKIQYREESFTLHVFPDPEVLPVKKGQLIAFSGNTGSSGGAHLHYEIRDTRSEWPLNPQWCGSTKIQDRTPPTVSGVYVMDPSRADETLRRVSFSSEKSSSQVKCSGYVGVGIDTYDTCGATPGFRYGIYSIRMYVDSVVCFSQQMDRFSFDHSSLINAHILYGHYVRTGKRIQKCFIEPYDALPIYDRAVGNGRIRLNTGERKTVRLEVSDFAGNRTEMSFMLVGAEEDELRPDVVASVPGADDSDFQGKKRTYFIDSSSPEEISAGGFSALFPAGAFYENCLLNVRWSDSSSVKIHDRSVPLNKSFTLSADVSGWNEAEREKLYLACRGKDGRYAFLGGDLKGDRLSAQVRTLGIFSIREDKKPPVIYGVGFDASRPVGRYMEVRVRDEESAIGSYRGEVDGRWVLMEYDYKTGRLVFDTSDIELAKGRHLFRLTVEDGRGNRSVLEREFLK